MIRVFNENNRTVIEMDTWTATKIARMYDGDPPDCNGGLMGFDRIAVVLALKYGVLHDEGTIRRIYQRAMKKIEAAL